MPKTTPMLLLGSLVVGLLSARALPEPEFITLRNQLDEVVDSTTINADGKTYRNTVVLLESPADSLYYKKASGIAAADGSKKMTTDHQFYIESLTKTFTATMVLQLSEEGLLGPQKLDTSLGDLKLFPPEVLDALHQIDGVSYGAGITVRQLLSHRTGMKNFTYDDEGGPSSDYQGTPFAPNSMLGVVAFDPDHGFMACLDQVQARLPEGTDPIESILKNGFPDGVDRNSFHFFSSPFRHWDYAAWKQDPNDRFAGLLNFYLSAMSQKALFAPGEDFKYTDTNYLILGLLIEKVTGNSLHKQLRHSILDPLEMKHTYMSYATDPPAGKWEQNLAELWALNNVPIVGVEINRSMMWTDAGIVSTVDDLRTFVRALIGGKLFRDNATWKHMTVLPTGVPMGYGLGVGISQQGDHKIFFHTGGAASWWTYDSFSDILFIGTMNDATGEGMQRFGRLLGGFQNVLKIHDIDLKKPF